jgi:hypothetical protein
MRPGGHGPMVADATISVNSFGPMTDRMQDQRAVAAAAASAAQSATDAPAAIPRW